ncbi:MAG: CocE/NonD family hydrolase [Bryobacterales bacterium]|nr:CocE/NonD family hydrolase [Bryobacterales bacterium]
MRCLLAICLAGVAGWAQRPEPGTYSQAQYEVRSTRGNRVPMRDGVRLSVDIYQPVVSSGTKLPAILTMTPYDNIQAGLVARSKWYAQRGYVQVLADVRGRYDSEGTWDPFTDKHKTDGYDLVEWIAQQPWCDGNVGMMGGSYLGWTQWWTASQAPPHLKAMAPQVAPPSSGLQNAPYQNGILVGWAMDWGARMAGRVEQVIEPGAYGGFTNHRVKNMAHLPQADIYNHMGVRDADWFDGWIKNNLDNEYWKRNSYDEYERVRVPTFQMTGWFDANFPGSPQNYMGMKKSGPTPESRRPQMLIGPWMHAINVSEKLAGIDYGRQSVVDLDGLICRWFDYWLKGVKNGVDKAKPVSVFVMGVNKWYQEDDWPLPQTQWTKYYLDSGGKANTLKGDGRLSRQPGGSNAAFDSYVYDPSKPTRSPYTGGHIDGAVDARLPAIGDEVLVYDTPALAEPVEVTGPISAKLYAATSARDTDWMVRLVDVGPDGYAALLCDGVMRARYRDPEKSGGFNGRRLSTIEPDRVYEYTIEFWRATGNVFLPGHKIRIEVSSSYFPYYLPNLNTGEDNNAYATKPVVARQKVYHSTEYPSHVVLPVIPRR